MLETKNVTFYYKIINIINTYRQLFVNIWLNCLSHLKILPINKVLIELPSNFLFYASIFSRATLGLCGNVNHNRIVLGKAGRSRWLGCKPIVRGVAMNPIDHPHGGGEGKRSSDSLKKSPWGRIFKWNNKRKIKFMDLI